MVGPPATDPGRLFCPAKRTRQFLSSAAKRNSYIGAPVTRPQRVSDRGARRDRPCALLIRATNLGDSSLAILQRGWGRRIKTPKYCAPRPRHSKSPPGSGWSPRSCQPGRLGRLPKNQQQEMFPLHPYRDPGQSDVSSQPIHFRVRGIKRCRYFGLVPNDNPLEQRAAILGNPCCKKSGGSLLPEAQPWPNYTLLDR